MLLDPEGGAGVTGTGEGTGGTGANDGSGGTAAKGNEDAGGTGGGNNGESRAEARIRALTDQVSELKEKLSEHDKAKAKQEQQKALERGEHEKVIASLQEELNAAKPLAEQWTTYSKSRREQLLTGLDDNDKALSEGMSLEKLELFVQRIAKQPPGKGAGGYPGGSPPPRTGKASPEEVKANIHDPKWREQNRGRIF